MRNDRPFGGPDPPAAAYFYSPDRAGIHAETWLGSYAGIARRMPSRASAGSTRRTASPVP